MATAITIQYSGIWNISSQANAKAAGTWPVPPIYALFSWGENNYGQLGLGNLTNFSSPKQVGSSSWNSIGATTVAGAAIKNGQLWTWGQNNFGQLGLNNTTYYSSPKQVGALTNWSSVAGGAAQFMIAIKTNGTLWAWGRNNWGNLGLGNVTYYSSPKQVGALTNWASVACGNRYAIAVKTDGTLWGWGQNLSGNLGLGNTTYAFSSPQQIGSLTNWANPIVNANATNTFAVKTDGTLWAWGDNTVGGLGLGNTTNYSSPKQVGALTNWSTTSNAQNYGMVAIKTDGTLWTWGNNSAGQLGLGNTTNYSSPKQVGASSDWYKSFATINASFVIKTNGTLWSCGNNSVGQLGLGNTTYYSSFKQIGSLTTWQRIAGGQNFILGIATI
jgi:alpha-tubulin suppressor-like RCC1 family protein